MPQPPRRHQSSHSPGSASSSALPSSHLSSHSSPSSRPLSSLAPRHAPPSPPPSLDPSSHSHPSPPIFLDGAPIPTSLAGLRALVDRLRPHLYIALSRLPSPPPSPYPTLSPQPSSSSPSPSPSPSSPLDWLSSLDLDSLLLTTLHQLPPSTQHTTSSIISTTLHTTLTQHLSYLRYTNHLITRTDEMDQRRKELAKAAAELERIKHDMQRMRLEGHTGGLRALGILTGAISEDGEVGDQQPTLAKRVDSTPKTLSVPLHKHRASIYHPRVRALPSASPSPSSSASPHPPRRPHATPFHLYHEQLQLESLALDEAVANYAELTATLVNMQKGAQLRPAQRMMLTWYSPLVAAIQKEQERAKTVKELKSNGGQVAVSDQHLPYLLHLSAPQLAVLTMHTMFSLALASAGDGREGLGGVRLVDAAGKVGHTVNMEVKMEMMRKDRHKMKQFLLSIVSQDGGQLAGGGGAAASGGGGGQGSLMTSPNVLSKLRVSKKNQWSDEVCVKLGAQLLQLLITTAAVPDVGSRHDFVPAFRHELVWSAGMGGRGTPKGQGVVMTDERVLSVVLRDHDATETMMPKLKPMIVPPKPWTSAEDGGYLSVPSRVMRSHGSLMQLAAVTKSPMPSVYRGLNFLSSIPWRINARILHAVETLWARGGGVAKLPSQTDFPLPLPQPQDASPTARKQAQRDSATAVRHNRNLHSLRCDVELKLSVARQFRGRSIYFPFNVDFRGRAYPIPPHLNHIGNDLCRGLLLFEERRRLGEKGVRWLMIHATNLWGQGKEKLPYDERVQWCKEHLDLMRCAAADPIGPADPSLPSAPARWWLQAEKPFQFLAACIELNEAYALPDPAEYRSALPVHQDGSCNGLQHYAALGRDAEGGTAVNLTPSGRPQDVYSVVCAEVLKRVAADAAAGVASAKLLEGKVTRKVVKQTVMTSVYGVTLIGAKEQIKARLLESPTIVWPEPADVAVRHAALYLAKVTLASLYSAFEGARKIQDWLGHCALLIASMQQPVSWVTPLGLPVIQPYRRAASYAVQTIMQQVNLASHSDLLPVSGQRQKSAFPPNFIHSLDATHMLMTALRCEQEGLTFTAVHDSYWTHAGEMDHMGRLLREEFVQLYEQPILQRLRDEWRAMFPELDFPEVPKVGQLQLDLVKQSPYFFN